MMREAQTEELSVIFVTRFLEQVYISQLCDKITVLRNESQLVGRYTTTGYQKNCSLWQMMGKDFGDRSRPQSGERQGAAHSDEDIVETKAAGLEQKGYIKPFDLGIHKGVSVLQTSGIQEESNRSGFFTAPERSDERQSVLHQGKRR